jgi:hypothetical protein
MINVSRKKGGILLRSQTTTLVKLPLKCCNVITSWACAYVQRKKKKTIGFYAIV